MAIDQLGLNNFKNKKKAFILKDSLNIFSALKNFRILVFFCLIVITLQFREPQSYGSNAGIIGIFVGYFAFEKVSKLLQQKQDFSTTNKDLVKKKKDIQKKTRNISQEELQPLQDLSIFRSQNSFFFWIPLKVLK